MRTKTGRPWLQRMAVMAAFPVVLMAAPFDPTVTREEADLIRQAVEIASTNETEAIALLTAKATPKSSAAIDYTIGNFYFQSGQETNAISAYQQALQKMPQFRAARVNLARLYLLGDQVPEAMRLLRELTTDGHGDADSYLLLGHALLLSDALVSAETAYRQSLMLHPQNPDAMIGLARALLPQDRPGESLALAQELLRKEPHRRELWALRANALMALDRAEEAASVLESARRLGFADAALLSTLGDLHLNSGRPEDAVACYEEAFAGAEPSVSRLLRAYEGFLLVRQTDGAARMRDRFEAIAKDQPASVSRDQRLLARRLTGDLAMQEGDAVAARKQYELLLEEDPLNGRTLLQVAELYRAAEQLEEAVMYGERAARIADVRVDALILHAQIEVQRERYTKALELLEAAQTLQPQERVQRYLDQVRRLQRFDLDSN